VPDTAEIRINPETNTLMREGVPSIINPYDMHALEAAVQIKETQRAIDSELFPSLEDGRIEIYSSLENVPHKQDNTVDFICSHFVLEHLTDLNAFFVITKGF